MCVAGASVAAVAGIASLAASPALLAMWGRKLARRNDTGGAAAHDRWHRLAHAVMRRPGVIAAATAAAMLALGLPATAVNWTPADSTVIPTDKSARVVSDAIHRDFDGDGATAGDGRDHRPVVGRAALRDYADRIRALDGVRSVAAPADLGSDTWRITAAVPGDPAGDAARDVVGEIRDLGAPSGKWCVAA